MLSKTTISVSALLGLAVNAGGQTNLVANGSFESPVIATANSVVAAGSPALTGWTIGGTSGIDLVRTLWQPGDGAQSISLNWTGPASIAQTVPTQAGNCYRLSFKLAAESPAARATMRTMNVLWNGGIVASLAFDPAGHTNSTMGWETHQMTVVAVGNDELRFQSTTVDNWGPALDAVSVVLSAAAGDVNCDCSVGLSDLAVLLAHFGTPHGAGPANGDLNGDGSVDLTDLSMLLANFGTACA